MIFNVLQRHINAGKRMHCLFCPVKLAIDEQSQGADAYVGFDFIRFHGVRFKTPCKVQRWINNFDQRKLAKPFNFLFPYGQA